MNTATSARAMLIVAFFGIGALTVQATGSSCVDCHSNPAIMQQLVPKPIAGSAEGEG